MNLESRKSQVIMAIPLLLYCLHLHLLFLTTPTPTQAYKISTLDAVGMCNQTIYLDDGPKSAAILTLTNKKSYDFTPMHCFIHFIAPMHKWSGLTGVLEEIDMRRNNDTTRHRAQNECVDYILVTDKTDVPHEPQCGTWSVTGRDVLNYLGYRRSLLGYCPSPSASGTQQCDVSKIDVEVSVSERNDVKWRPHRGFTLVVTAYTYSFRENECAVGLRSCGAADHHGHQHKCIHHSLWCDDHINCAQPRNLDESSCFTSFGTMDNLVPVMVGPWVGAALLVLLLLAGVVYWRRSRPQAQTESHPPQELNSYAESYEVSSTLSSTHHMAIQVRVVCNSGHGVSSNGGAHLAANTQLPPPHSFHRWPRPSPPTIDLPPSYESLFPHGPPSPRSGAAATPASAASLDITATTTSLLSLRSSPGTISPGNAYSSAAAATATQTSSIVIPLGDLCSTSTRIPTITTTTITSVPSCSHNSATSSTPSATTSPPASCSAAPENAPSVEFTPLVQPEDSVISLSSLCGESHQHHNVSTSHQAPSSSNPLEGDDPPPPSATSESNPVLPSKSTSDSHPLD